tara:strand:- start:1080 stop:1805 length:726 start_codon:yes stop_codon:yes gene_type:complete
MALPKWTDERTNALSTYVGDESPVSQETVAAAAEELDTTSRSIASKLRKMGHEVELAAARNQSKFSSDQEATLRTFIESNSGEYTYVQIAEYFENNSFTPKSIQGKILSMELTQHVKAAPKAESTKTYSDVEEATFLNMVHSGAFVEQIAEALNRSVNSIRGKALSFLRSGEIDSIPRQENTKGSSKVDPLVELGDIAALTVEQIAESIGKTARGVKTMLTRRGLVASDYDGASKKEKAAD